MAARTWTPHHAYLVRLYFLCLSLLGFSESRKMATLVGEHTIGGLLTSPPEASALLSFRYSLHSQDHHWPEASDPCSTWRGVQCENGHVVKIELSGSLERASYLPVLLLPLLQFPLLRTLNASGYQLSGSLPSWLGNLKSLEVLDFSSASLSGPIPSSLGRLSDLKFLSLANNNLTGFIPAAFGQLANLRSLDLSGNRLEGTIPNTLGKLRQLKMLNFSFNQLRGELPADLGALRGLQSLGFARNNLGGPIPAELGAMACLTDLNLASNFFTGSIPAKLGDLTELTSLILRDNGLTGSIPSQISNCANLRFLILDNNNLSGVVPSSLWQMPNLVTISLSGNQLSGMLPPEMLHLSKAERIVLSNNSFTGMVPTGLLSLKTLVLVDLSNNYFGGTLPDQLLSRKTSVILKGNCFSFLRQASEQRTSFDCSGGVLDGHQLKFSHGRMVDELSYYPLPDPSSSTGGGNHLGAILGGVFGGLGLIAVVAVLVVLLIKHERKAESRERERRAVIRRSTGIKPMGGRAVNMSRLGQSFTYEQLLAATGHFDLSNMIMAGHTGDLYKGVIDGPVNVVVKRIELARFKKDAYISELEFFGKGSHARLVPLLGHCLDRENEKLLVYKYMPNGDLAYALHRKDSPSRPEDVLQSLDWITRLKIAIGVAEGLVYLHHECSPPIVHRDIKASSILLDDKYEVRLGSLTEARIQEGDHHANIITRLLRLSKSSDQDPGSPVAVVAFDVFCFGKVLLELVSGKLGISGSIDPGADAWLDWALPLIDVHDREPVIKLMDPSLIVDEDLMEEVWAVAIIAKSCLNPKASRRPNMKHILKALENPQKVVRHEHSGPLKSRHSSHGSWNSALFGAWRHFSSENVFGLPGSVMEERSGGDSKTLNEAAGSVRIGGSREIFPVPLVPGSPDLEFDEDSKEEDDEETDSALPPTDVPPIRASPI